MQQRIEGLSATAAVLGASGSIIAVNDSWRRFGAENGLRAGSAEVGSSYLRACDAPGAGSTEGPTVATAIHRILNGSEEPFRKIYSCHAPHRASWYRVEVASLRYRSNPSVLVTHVPVDEAALRHEIADAERRLIARELHDTTAQNLAAALLDLEQVADGQRASAGVVSERLSEAVVLCRRSLHEVRSLSYELVPEGVRAKRLARSLKRLATTFTRRTGINLVASVASLGVGDDELPAKTAEAVYRAAWESLRNVRRHSGGNHATLRVHRVEDRIELEVNDRGHGIAPDAERGKGLTDVLERLEACGGSLEVKAEAVGTAVRVSVPLAGREHPGDLRWR
jgi:signal transduction histidine kinase